MTLLSWGERSKRQSMRANGRWAMETHSRESRPSVTVHEGLMSQVELMAAFASGARFEALGNV